MRIVVILIAMLGASACTSMLLGNPSAGEPVATGQRSSAPSGQDSAISGAIRQQLRSDPDLGDYAIGIRTSAGVVTLSGTVGSYPDRDRAVQIARDTSGVQRVDNRIIVNTNL
jgi:osmotically-inducible protein OsmY